MTREDVIGLPVWKRFSPISLDEMGAVKLMNRIDTKFLASMRQLPVILDRACDDYRVQEIDGIPVADYDTLYFDTERLDMYTRHHNKVLVRNKVRTRTYVGSDLSFLEIKHKNNKGRTKKKRIKIQTSDFGDFSGNDEAVRFLGTQVKYGIDELKPQVRTIFNRITLVNKGKTERLTIDFNLRFVNEQNGISADFGDVMIIELKQDGLVHSDMRDILNDLRIKNVSMSKYCMGTVLTNPDAKSNRFKKKMVYVRKLNDNN